VINMCAWAPERVSRATGFADDYDTVRGAFEEGPAAFPGAAMRQESHVQIAVRIPSAFLGSSARPATVSESRVTTVRIIDPYREQNRRTQRWLDSLSHKEMIQFLKEIGILDKRGNLAPKYRTPGAPLRVKPQPAKPKSTKTSRRKRAS
jgi:hypothetical protein